MDNGELKIGDYDNQLVINEFGYRGNYWSVDNFLKVNSNKLINLDLELIDLITSLPVKKRKLVLQDNRVKEYLKKSFLVYGKEWGFCNAVFELIDFSEIIEIFDDEFINEFFGKNITGHEYILFSCAFNNAKNINDVLDVIIENDNLFKKFSEYFCLFSSSVTILDYEHLKKLLKRMEKDDSHYNFRTMSISSEETARELIKDDHSLDILYWLIQRMPLEVVNEFFLNDARSVLMIQYLDYEELENLLEWGVVFGDKIITSSDFFEILKCGSLLNFRRIINLLEEHCTNPYYIEEKRKEYYDQLIKSYQVESGMFKVYEELLNGKDFFKRDITRDKYLVDKEISKEKNITKENLIKETNKKLSELIVDALFYDSIYNVWINIKELLRYNSYLDESEKTLSKERIEFYKLFLEIDNVLPIKKIELYNNYKDKNINQIFYDDIRKTKNLAYNKIKDKLVNPLEGIKYENNIETKKNGVKVYDLRNKEFFMLVRRLDGLYNENRTKHVGNSYSLISNVNTEIFHETDGIIYGYNNLEIDKVIHMFEMDSFTSGYESNLCYSTNSTQYPNRISTAEQLANSSGYSEILIKNKQITDDEYVAMKPDFIVVIDEVNERSIEASKILNIPIVIISKNKKPYIDMLPNSNLDHYAIGFTNEEERKKQR